MTLLRQLLKNSLMAGSLMGTGDLISQNFIEKKTFDKLEWQRPCRFFVIGAVMVGPVLRLWYGYLNKIFPLAKSAKNSLKKVAVDQVVMAPMFLGIFITVNGLMQRNTLDQIKLNLKSNYKDILVTNYKIWPLVQIVNFSFIPLNGQATFVQFFALFWNCYLAFKLNKAAENKDN